MKYIKKYNEDFKNVIGSGSYNITYDIDDNFILKSPLKPNYSADLNNNVLQFKFHIDFMKFFPQIFPNVKMLDKQRASIEKVDTKLATEEINYVFNLCRFPKEGESFIYNLDKTEHATYPIYHSTHFMNYLYNDNFLNQGIPDGTTLNLLKTYIDIDETAKKWYDFIILLKTTLKGVPTRNFIFNEDIPFTYEEQMEDFEEDKFNLDLNNSNFGIDKNGNIKLIDF